MVKKIPFMPALEWKVLGISMCLNLNPGNIPRRIYLSFLLSNYSLGFSKEVLEEASERRGLDVEGTMFDVGSELSRTATNNHLTLITFIRRDIP
jgi:hypothetical protein